MSPPCIRTDVEAGCQMPNDPPRYKLYYEPEFDYTTVTHLHVEPSGTPGAPLDNALTKYIDKLVLSIEDKGLINPIVIQMRSGSASVHPGKCRVAAFIKLGRPTIPAIVVDANNDYRGKSDEISANDAEGYFTGDCIAEWSWKSFSVKKRPR